MSTRETGTLGLEARKQEAAATRHAFIELIASQVSETLRWRPAYLVFDKDKDSHELKPKGKDKLWKGGQLPASHDGTLLLMPKGFWVLDDDRQDPPEDSELSRRLEALEGRTLITETDKGRHYWFRTDNPYMGKCNKATLFGETGWDSRCSNDEGSTGTGVFVPGSCRRQGKGGEWKVTHRVADCSVNDIMDLPDWLEHEVGDQLYSSAGGSSSVRTNHPPGGETRVSTGGGVQLMAGHGLAAQLSGGDGSDLANPDDAAEVAPGEGEGGRNTLLACDIGTQLAYEELDEATISMHLHNFNHQVCRPPLPDDEVDSIVRNIVGWMERRGIEQRYRELNPWPRDPVRVMESAIADLGYRLELDVRGMREVFFKDGKQLMDVSSARMESQIWTEIVSTCKRAVVEVQGSGDDRRYRVKTQGVKPPHGDLKAVVSSVQDSNRRDFLKEWWLDGDRGDLYRELCERRPAYSDLHLPTALDAFIDWTPGPEAQREYSFSDEDATPVELREHYLRLLLESMYALCQEPGLTKVYSHAVRGEQGCFKSSLPTLLLPADLRYRLHLSMGKATDDENDFHRKAAKAAVIELAEGSGFMKNQKTMRAILGGGVFFYDEKYLRGVEYKRRWIFLMTGNDLHVLPEGVQGERRFIAWTMFRKQELSERFGGNAELIEAWAEGHLDEVLEDGRSRRDHLYAEAAYCYDVLRHEDPNLGLQFQGELKELAKQTTKDAAGGEEYLDKVIEAVDAMIEDGIPCGTIDEIRERAGLEKYHEKFVVPGVNSRGWPDGKAPELRKRTEVIGKDARRVWNWSKLYPEHEWRSWGEVSYSVEGSGGHDWSHERKTLAEWHKLGKTGKQGK